MIAIENTEVMGWEAAIRGMRNPMNSWEKSDSGICFDEVACHTCRADRNSCKTRRENKEFVIGYNDLSLMTRLRNAGTDHRKFMRMITVYLDITAPLYWWKEFKTYRAGRRFGDDEPGIIDDGYLEYDIEMNSCSTMHKIAEKEFTLEDFSCEHLTSFGINTMNEVIRIMNTYRRFFNNWDDIDDNSKNAWRLTSKKDAWWQMIQLLPSSYNQRRTVMLNYEVLTNIYKSRYNHRLDEWCEFRKWIESLPYSELITGKGTETYINQTRPIFQRI